MRRFRIGSNEQDGLDLRATGTKVQRAKVKMQLTDLSPAVFRRRGELTVKNKEFTAEALRAQRKDFFF